MTPAALETHGLECSFGGLRAVADLSMRVQPGKITALIGPNGAGKSTVINMLSGLLRPTVGRIVLEGLDVTGHPAWRLTRAGVIRTFQNGRLFSRLSVLENTLVGASGRLKAGMLEIALRTPRFRAEEKSIENRAREYLDVLGLGDDADRAVGELSYGKQRQIEIARALVGRPRILLLDEPAAGLNSAEQEKLIAYLRELRSGGLTILLIEHHMGMVMQLADHMIVLNFGRMIFEGTASEAQASPVVAEAYLGRRGRHDLL